MLGMDLQKREDATSFQHAVQSNGTCVALMIHLTFFGLGTRPPSPILAPAVAVAAVETHARKGMEWGHIIV